ncbi:MAG: PLP-dependent transferase [Deltaproteobacteria bacterium]|nr:PLP-dependent transferase [Deltaproteobacteria bacterium]
MKFKTKAIHAGQHPDHDTGAVIPPIYQTSTYAQPTPGHHQEFEYTRAGNPNFRNLETALAAMEGGQHAVVYSSGLGAETALFSLLSSGDHVVVSSDVYGGTYRLLAQMKSRFGIDFTSVDDLSPEAFGDAATERTKLFWLESPTNPRLQIVDITAVSKRARSQGITTVVDNTFASPYLQNPLALGADVVLHSTTKYVGGHSDLIGGALITSDAALHDRLHFARMAYGLNPSPFDTWLAHRGLKTLALRMEAHCVNAAQVAGYLQKHDRMKIVYYPGLESHPGHAVAKRQMKAFGGMVSAVVDGSSEKLHQHLGSLTCFRLAESLGGVESLVCHPATMTHASLPAEVRKQRGISDTLIRLSVGIEDVEDLLEDLEKFLKKV